MRFFSKNKGLTLVEVLVSITILAIVIIPVTNFFAQSFKANTKNELQLALHTEAISYFERIKTAVAEGTPLDIDRIEPHTFEIPSPLPCSEFTYTEKIENKLVSKNEISYTMTVTIMPYNKTTSEEFANLLNSTNFPEPEKLFKIDLQLVSTDSSLQPVQLQVIKLSANGCGAS